MERLFEKKGRESVAVGPNLWNNQGIKSNMDFYFWIIYAKHRFEQETYYQWTDQLWMEYSLMNTIEFIRM